MAAKQQSEARPARVVTPGRFRVELGHTPGTWRVTCDRKDWASTTDFGDSLGYDRACLIADLLELNFADRDPRFFSLEDEQ